MDFVKMQGLGNDFVVVRGPVELSTESIVAWCDRRFGVGADGVLEATSLADDLVRMRYWNADGGEAEMCGNGLRCVARHAYDRGWVNTNEFMVETAMGDMPVQVLAGGLVRALVGEPQLSGPPIEFEDVMLHPVSVGNPHAVIFVDDPADADVGVLGPRVEADSRFPDRTNVEFVTPRGPAAIEMRIWERGVGETMASGTGATAGAFAAVNHRGVTAPVTVGVPGGELVIEFDGAKAWMVGPATTVYTGTIEP